MPHRPSSHNLLTSRGLATTLALSPALDDCPCSDDSHSRWLKRLQAVQVEVSFFLSSRGQLHLDYQIYHSQHPNGKIDGLNWSTLKTADARFYDYLWQRSCLECFIGDQHHSHYVELNVSPSADYALYYFDAYRQPKQMPPRRLAITTPPVITAHRTANNSSQYNTHVFDNPRHDFGYHRHIQLDTKQLPTGLQDCQLIHPCVVLLIHGTPIYYAHSHPTPADFHNRHYWLASA